MPGIKLSTDFERVVKLGPRTLTYDSKIEIYQKRRRPGCLAKQRRYTGGWYGKIALSRHTDFFYHADIEAGYGSWYQLIMNGNFPKQNVVAKTRPDQSIYYKLLSREIKSKELGPSSKIYRNDRSYSAEFTCRTDTEARTLAAALVSGYYFEEEDLTKSNLRRTKDGRIIRIDAGASGWPITCQYHHRKFSPHVDDPLLDSIKPIDAFPIDADDLREFPLHGGSKAKPHFTVHVNFANSTVKAAFDKCKWMYFFKILLIDPQPADNIYKRSFYQFSYDSDETEERREDQVRKFTQILAHNLERYTQLKNVLLSIPEFCKCILENQAEFKRELMQEFVQFNLMKKGKGPVLFDLKAIEAKWDSLVGELHVGLIINDAISRGKFKTVLQDFINAQYTHLGVTFAPVKNEHPKITAMRNLEIEFSRLSLTDTSAQICGMSRIITELDRVMAMPRDGFGLWAPTTQKNWGEFKKDHGAWVKGTQLAASNLSSVTSATMPVGPLAGMAGLGAAYNPLGAGAAGAGYQAHSAVAGY